MTTLAQSTLSFLSNCVCRFIVKPMILQYSKVLYRVQKSDDECTSNTFDGARRRLGQKKIKICMSFLFANRYFYFFVVVLFLAPGAPRGPLVRKQLLFLIFTQPIDAIDPTRVTVGHLQSYLVLKQYLVIKVILSVVNLTSLISTVRA